MHVAVLGAGVVGVTTAYFLAREGCHVTLIDQADELASGASHANGGQLSYSFADPLAKPGLLAELPRIMFGRDPAIRVSDWLNVRFLRWGGRVLRECTSERARRNTRHALELAQRSAELMAELQEAVPIRFDDRRPGKLVLLSSPDSVAAAQRSLELKRHHGCDINVLSLEEATEVEPALKDFSRLYAGAIFSRNDAVGDARLFAQNLGAWLADSGSMTVRLNTKVQSLVARQRRLHRVETDGEPVHADAAVVCLGVESNEILKPLGLSHPMYPVRGYSVTLPPGTAAPSVSITDLDYRIVYSRLANRIRIAGFADFVGFQKDLDQRRVQDMLEIARRTAPEAAVYHNGHVEAWGGNRPMTPSGQPLTGATAVEGVFLNIGHGMLGWTLACATAFDTAQSVVGAKRHAA